MPTRPPRDRASHAPSKARLVCDLLVRDGLLAHEHVERLRAQAQRTNERIEEVVLEAGLLSETDMLRSLAAHYKVQFVTTERLSKADVSRAVLDMIPRRFAEHAGLGPVLFDSNTHSLTVVTADPDDVEVLREVKLASGARDVKAVLARPAAIKAFIQKTYAGEAHAFALLDRQAHMHFHAGMVDVFERNVVPVEAPKPPPPPPPRPPPSAPRLEAKRPPERAASEPELPKAPPTLVPPSLMAASGPSFSELLNVLVSLLENSRADLRGHSAQVARLCRRMAEKMGMDAAATAGLVTAAYVHDLGKMGQYHLTALNCSEYEGHRVAAQKALGIPSRLLEPVRIGPEAMRTVEHMYERYDGKGFPDGLAGKDIELGSRLLAICDTYADLTQNPRNPFRKALSPQEACAAINSHRGTIFDPNLVDFFRHTVAGEDLKARLLADRAQALLVDIDPEETTVLELRMVEQGFVVKSARTTEQALKVLAEGDTDLVIGEVDLGSSDGLALLSDARKQPWGKDVPWVIYTRRQERMIAQRAFELGVLDYVNKPANADVLVAKLKALLAQRAAARPSRGVSGQLEEMGLPDMVQVLFHGRKSGNLRIRAREGQGEIHFSEGAVFEALWGDLRGEDAFYAMLKLREGEFALDPSYKATTRNVHQSAEALLLEGMRRMDEGIG